MDFSSFPLILGQSERITSWLTPVWILMTGIMVGLVLVFLLWGLLSLAARIPGVNALYEKSGTRVISGLVLSAIIFGLLYLWSSAAGYWSEGPVPRDDWAKQLFLMLVFYSLGSLLAGFGLVAAVSSRRNPEVQRSIWFGFPFWLLIIGVVATVYSLGGWMLEKFDGFGVVIPVENSDGLIRSIAQLPTTGIETVTVEIPYPTPEGGQEVPEAALNGWQLRTIAFLSSQPIEVATVPVNDDTPREKVLDIAQSTRATGTIPYFPKTGESPVFPETRVDKLYIANRGTGPATLEMTIVTAPRYPEVFLFYWAAAGMVVLFFGYFIFVAACPKIHAVAHSTFKTEVSQPVFLILLVIGGIFTVATIYTPYNTFGEDIKMYKDSGLMLLRVLGVFLAIWAASKSLAEEIEGRTALTVLSKPVSRRQFILGKYSGIGLAVAMLFIVLGLWFLFWVSYKPIYDSQESTVRDFTWENCFREMSSTIPGLVLAWLEAMVFAAISVVISTRLGILANFLICFAIYVLGHLTALIVQSTEAAEVFEGVAVFGQVISIIIPVLDHFDINAAITGGNPVPLAYLGWATIYCGLYGLAALLLALVLFEDRDLA